MAARTPNVTYITQNGESYKSKLFSYDWRQGNMLSTLSEFMCAMNTMIQPLFINPTQSHPYKQ
jgi:hypothetical protein